MTTRTIIQGLLLSATMLGSVAAHADTAAAIVGYPYNISQAANFDQYSGGRIRNISTTNNYQWRMSTMPLTDNRFYVVDVMAHASVSTAALSCYACSVSATGTESCGATVSTTSTTPVRLSLGSVFAPSGGGLILIVCNLPPSSEVLNYRWQ